MADAFILREAGRSGLRSHFHDVLRALSGPPVPPAGVGGKIGGSGFPARNWLSLSTPDRRRRVEEEFLMMLPR